MTRLTKAIYIILFAALLFHPHVITGHLFSIPQAFAQSLATLTIFALAYVTYLLNRREIRRREREKEAVERELEISGRKLVDSYKYIGLVNRRLPLLKKLTTDLLKRRAVSRQDKKNIFEELLATAVTSIINGGWGIFRFVDVLSGNTVKEFIYQGQEKISLNDIKIGNRQLMEVREKNLLSKGSKNFSVISSSDQTSAIKCFLIFSDGSNDISGDYSVLQSIVDQTLLFYKYLRDA